MTMWEDILAQPENLRQVIQRHTENLANAHQQINRLSNQTKGVVFTGVGSGLNATIPASYYLMNHGLFAQSIDTTELIYYLMPGLKDFLLVLNTRSGETAELVRAAKLAKDLNLSTIAVTNEPESTVGRLANFCLPTYSRWDQLVVISAYGGMLASELILSSMRIGNHSQLLKEIQAIPEILESVLAKTITIRDDLGDLIGDSRPIYLLGRGPSLASAHGGALVIEETSRQAVVPMASGLFRQGPIEVVNQRFRAIIFEGGDETAGLSRRLAEDLIEKNCGIVWVGSSELKGALNLTIPHMAAYLLPFLEIIPCQVLAHDLALRSHITPGSVNYIEKVITSEEGIQAKGE